MFISSNEEAAGSAGPAWRLETLVGALRAAGEPSRLRALALLARGELAVGELAMALAQSQPRVSRHVKVLTEHGLVERAPEGAWVFYRLPPEGTPERALADSLITALDPADPSHRRDVERLERVRTQRADQAQSYFEENAADWARIRALHLPDVDIEAAILKAAGAGPFERMVDVGVGAGRMLVLFAPRARRAEGFDTSRQMLAVARAALAEAGAHNASVRLGDIYQPPVAAGAADLVTMHQVLHFLPDPRRAVAEAAGLLRPGGRLVIADFAPHQLEFLRERHQHRRLGFSDQEVGQWGQAAGVELAAVATLAPADADSGALTVKIWAGVKSAQAERRAA